MIEVENINFKLYKDNIITCIINIRNKDISNQLVILILMILNIL